VCRLSAFLVLVAVISVPAVQAERPSAPKLLPKSTLGYVRVADSRELVKAFQETSMGRLGQDDQIRPLVMHLYGSVTQAFARVQEQIGVSLGEILNIPQGEVCVAFVGRERGDPAIVIMMDVGQNQLVVRKLIDAAARQDGNAKTETIDDVTLTLIDEDAVFCERDETVLFSSSPELIKEMLRTWDGDEGVETLADNVEFSTIMRSSMGSKGERPHVTWFADPIGIFEQAARDNGGAQMVLAMFPLLGLEQLKSAGGSIVFATEDFDSISYMHLLMGSPRKGILNMIAIESGDVEPEDWVPDDAASYMTVHWNLQQTLDELKKMIDAFQGEGAFDNAVKRRMSDPLGIDFQTDILDQLDDRMTHVSWFEKPARINSGTNLLGVKLKDSAASRRTLDTILSKVGERATRKTYRGISYHEFTPRRKVPPEQVLVRQPTPCVAIVGDYLLATDSAECLKAAITAKKNPNKSFAEGLDYKLIASQIDSQLGSSEPGMISFSRPEETMRSFYQLATSPTTRRRLDELADSNAGLRALNNALRENPLPPFSVIAKYLAPAGGMLVVDQSGLHYTAFGLKRE
jgi:hypothetical protein